VTSETCCSVRSEGACRRCSGVAAVMGGFSLP
jgi:hypothetical protein